MRVIVCLAILACVVPNAWGQAPETGGQARPAITANIEIVPSTRLLITGELHEGTNYAYRQWITGVAITHRMRRILKPHRTDIDEDKEYTLTIGGGYQFLDTTQSTKPGHENRIYVQATPRYILLSGFRAHDENRFEFRSLAGPSDVRYRNKLTVDRPTEARSFSFTPYVSGELIYDRNLHSWTQIRYTLGAQFPYKQSFMLDAYYMRKNCATCSPNPLNVLGVSINLFFRNPKK